MTAEDSFSPPGDGEAAPAPSVPQPGRGHCHLVPGVTLAAGFSKQRLTHVYT